MFTFKAEGFARRAQTAHAARALIVLFCVASLSACVVAPYRAYGGSYGQLVPPVNQGGVYDQPSIVVDIAPPAPYFEVIPVLPFPGALWIGGYWGWQGGRHYWVPGRYERARPGYGWNAHSWVQQGGRWHLRGGGWVRL